MSLPEDLSDALRTDAFNQYTLQSKLVENRSWACCSNCINLKEYLCGKNGLHIPPKVAVLGCGQWDGLPF